ncbi:hypothetical protein L596_022517 [Steinernema carpocapsae]|uniref:Uncharacterized protein n=1 Tax=Steinernema carpocapsae TaxID=34508 RepID=A0A4U5MM07_STECR|nr:hypothetical protein L596_022517 [Steinernema carpocapsae]
MTKKETDEFEDKLENIKGLVDKTFDSLSDFELFSNCQKLAAPFKMLFDKVVPEDKLIDVVKHEFEKVNNLVENIQLNAQCSAEKTTFEDVCNKSVNADIYLNHLVSPDCIQNRRTAL